VVVRAWIARGTAVGTLLCLSLAAALPPARAEDVLERIARSGELRLVGRVDQPPLLVSERDGAPSGYGVVVAQRVADLLSQALGRPVSLRFEPVGTDAGLDQQLRSGAAELACGVPFTWELDQSLDFSRPIALSGLRLMAPAGRFGDDLAGLGGRRIGVVAGSLAEADLRGRQPAARIVTFPTLRAALADLEGARVEAVYGDSLLLRGMARQLGLSGMVLTPRQPFERYAFNCVMPEDASAFANVVNRAIVQLQQDYLDGEPTAVASVSRWFGPGSAVNLPPEAIRNLFDLLLTGVESLRPVAPAAPAR
jgi:polar amino acid transport system substrate-binding protein